jgi:hypothetical protein
MTFDPDAAPYEEAWQKILNDKEKRAALSNVKSAKVIHLATDKD